MTLKPERQPGKPSETPKNPQLSADTGVPSGMSSFALDGVLPIGSPNATGAERIVSDPPDLSVPLQGLTDVEIMLRVKAGDDAAFNLLVEKFRRPMVSFMYRMTHNAATAEELAQEVFLRVYRSRASYAANAKFTTWLYRIATNLGVNYARDTRHERPAVTVNIDESDEETGLSVDVPDLSLNAEQDILRRERLAAIKRHVQSLPERQRMAVFMHKYQNMDYKQIAEILHLSESATKSLLFRAYETLRDKLKDYL